LGAHATGADYSCLDKDWVEEHAIPEPPPAPIECGFIQVLIKDKADVSGVADLSLGTSWLHEVVRCDWMLSHFVWCSWGVLSGGCLRSQDFMGLLLSCCGAPGHVLPAAFCMCHVTHVIHVT